MCLDKGRSREGEGEPAFKGEYFSTELWTTLERGWRWRFYILSKKLESVEEDKRIDNIPFVVRTHDQMALAKRGSVYSLGE